MCTSEWIKVGCTLLSTVVNKETEHLGQRSLVLVIVREPVPHRLSRSHYILFRGLERWVPDDRGESPAPNMEVDFNRVTNRVACLGARENGTLYTVPLSFANATQ